MPTSSPSSSLIPSAMARLRRVRGQSLLGLLVVLAMVAGGQVLFLGPASGGGAGRVEAAPFPARPAATFPVAAPAYYRPVIVAGKAFPVARSNFLSLLEFPNNWHAPRMRLINGQWKLVGVHLGIDIVAERGTPILAMEPGVVENVGWTFYSGTRIGVRGVDGRYYLYAHLTSVQPGIGPGAHVAAGSILGRVGNTGYGPPGHRDEFPAHLHFGIEAADGQWVNPYPTLARLYDALVRETTRSQTALDRMAAAGKRRAWTSATERTYMSLNPPGGE